MDAPDDVDADQEQLPPIDIENPDPIGTARRMYGKTAGTLLAAGMFGLDKVLRDKVKPDSVQVQESPTEPVDVDTDGIVVDVDEATSVNAPALERRAPIVATTRKKPRR